MDPSSLSLRLYPDPVLRAQAERIAEVDAGVRALAQRMIEVMRQERGIGLAGPQVGVDRAIFVVEIKEADSDQDPSIPQEIETFTGGPRVYINPEIIQADASTELGEEGCLSLPDIRGQVPRPIRIRVRALDAEGQPFEHEAGGLLARCIQHEYDHLMGVLIIDRFTQMDRLKNRRLIRDLRKQAGLE